MYLIKIEMHLTATVLFSLKMKQTKNCGYSQAALFAILTIRPPIFAQPISSPHSVFFLLVPTLLSLVSLLVLLPCL